LVALKVLMRFVAIEISNETKLHTYDIQSKRKEVSSGLEKKYGGRRAFATERFSRTAFPFLQIPWA